MGKIAAFGEKAREIVFGLKFNCLKEGGSALGRVDFGVLAVAMMVAVLDGAILPSEPKAFSKLAAHLHQGVLPSGGRTGRPVPRPCPSPAISRRSSDSSFSAELSGRLIEIMKERRTK